MSPFRKETVSAKLVLLDEVIGKLEIIAGMTEEKFAGDFFVSDTAARNLALGVEIITDIGNHILSEVFHAPAATYKDILVFLGQRGVVPNELIEDNLEMTDFRNLLIHAYEGIKLDQMYLHAKKAPQIFHDFSKYFVAFLEKYDRGEIVLP